MNPEAHLSWDTDVLIIGSGAAGLRTALAASEHANVTLITKTTLTESNTHYAQGGIAVAMNLDDTIALHIKDTCDAGAGLCNVKAVEMMVSEGIPRVAELLDWGANFDWEGTLPRFTREAAHSRRRIVHKGDATGRETTDVLIQRVLNTERIHILQNTFVIDLLTDADIKLGSEDTTACYGVTAMVEEQIACIRAKATILATGGLGRIYPCTSNPKVATGDGFAAAWRAGCEMIDMEFVQFHPTTLFLDGAPNFLISEAVRGEGGKLLSIRGERFMEKYHEKGELAPRDVVSRAIQIEMDLTGFPCVFLDITDKPEDFIHERFPTTKRYGLNINMDLIPVRPGAHFMMGGIRTNTDTQTNLKGLYACGEVACTGVHGANRLASNSLLECLVYGARAGTNAATFAESQPDHPPATPVSSNVGTSLDAPTNAADNTHTESIKDVIRDALWEHVSIERNGEGLQETLAELQDLMGNLGNELTNPEVTDIATVETVNMLNVALMITQSALARTESRGAHYRTDFPTQDDTEWQQRILITRDNAPEAISL